MTHLRLDQNQIDKQHNKIVLDILVGEPLAVRALGQADPFAQGAVIGLAVDRVQVLDGRTAGDAYRHACVRLLKSKKGEEFSIQSTPDDQ